MGITNTNKANQAGGFMSDVDGADILPKTSKDETHCSPECQYLAQWEHPFFYHTAWCWKQMKDLTWYDYYLADCVSGKPDAALVSLKNNGRTGPPSDKVICKSD